MPPNYGGSLAEEFGDRDLPTGVNGDVADCEGVVRNVFVTEFPNADYWAWNTEMNDQVAENIIRNVGRASIIRVERFILDLR